MLVSSITWVSVKDRLPKEKSMVLIYQPPIMEDVIFLLENGAEDIADVCDALFIHGQFIKPETDSADWTAFEPVYWAEMPESPEIKLLDSE